ncbi:MAG: class I SAM-dependent methyltransferase, partial [Candidatus Thorarchaeota archaeon]
MTTQNLQRTSGFGYRIMASYLKFRERFRKPEDFLRSLGIKRGDVILDHGCGIGSYSIPAAKMVGVTGKVYALDIHPIGIEKTQKRAEKEGLRNLETILSGLENGLPDQYVDIVLL